ncbi:MAG: hypothetical protein AAF533_19835 [Acidobacteriota bacterium]
MSGPSILPRALLALTLAVLPSTAAHAEPTPAEARLVLDEAAPSRDGWLTGLQRRQGLRLTLDTSSRANYATNSDAFSGVHALGLDLHRVFGGRRGDWGTLLVQTYLTKLDDAVKRPPFFEDEDDWELVYRIVRLDITSLSRGGFNIRLGHVELPYGLEHSINTNGTLRDFNHGRNLGVKADWGVGVHGRLPALSYELTLTRGSGNEYFDRDDPFALTARVSTPTDRNLVLGVSAFHGEVANPGAIATWRAGRADADAAPDVGTTLRRTRFGVDVRRDVRSLTWLGELSVGRDREQDVVNALLELDWRGPAEKLMVHVRGQAFFQDFSRGWVDDVSLVLGLRRSVGRHWALSAQVTQNLTSFGDGPRGAVLSTQVRHRF